MARTRLRPVGSVSPSRTAIHSSLRRLAAEESHEDERSGESALMVSEQSGFPAPQKPSLEVDAGSRRREE
jgi:hypothetical protein